MISTCWSSSISPLGYCTDREAITSSRAQRQQHGKVELDPHQRILTNNFTACNDELHALLLR
jgi:hypothetical protein